MPLTEPVAPLQLNRDLGLFWPRCHQSGLSVASKSVPVKQSSILLLAPGRGRLAAVPQHQAAADWTAPLLRRAAASPPPPLLSPAERAARDAEQRRNPRGVERTELGVQDKL